MQVHIPVFLALVRPTLFRGSTPEWQAEPMRCLINEGIRRRRCVEDIAYVLATAFHETARFKYTAEIGRGRGKSYGDAVTLSRGRSERYYGRGYVQLTWLANYARLSVRLTKELQREIDLVNNPEMAETPEIASFIIWEGMVQGLFTGQALNDHIEPGRARYLTARSIVNGEDDDALIASYAHAFESALRRAIEAYPSTTVTS